MRAWLSLSVDAFRALPPDAAVSRLADAQARRHRGSEPDQVGAWDEQVAALRAALAGAPGAWWLLLEAEMVRLGRRADAVLLTDRAALVLEFKRGTQGYAAADLREAEDYALDLHDFLDGAKAHPIVPVLVAVRAPPRRFDPLLIWHGVIEPTLATNGDGLGVLIREVQGAIPAPVIPLDPVAWIAASYRPVPNIVEAATLLYARHGVAEIAASRAGADNLARTGGAIRAAVAAAERDGRRIVVFVTGIPGAGKTLCGLNAVFGAARELGAAFLTGNAPLVAVLGEALARDAHDRRGGRIGDRRRETEAALQNVHRFLEHHVTRPEEVPHERVVVFDEAQRAWDRRKAVRDTQNRRSRLTASEPAHMLEIMGRCPGWSVVVALIGSGQEINTGEAGLAEWGAAIAGSGEWEALVAPYAVGKGPPAARLSALPAPWLRTDPALHLDVPVRAIREPAVPAWVEAVLEGEARAARAIAGACSLPVWWTRDLEALRRGLRRFARGRRRGGLVASSGARRLRAEGLGAELRGDDAVVAWFLEQWPDVRASDALEVPATEYSCQGLELDVVGLAWGGDLVRGPPNRDPGGWRARAFTGRGWGRTPLAGEARGFRLNSYRVLMTRARHETILWVPRGDPDDATRPPAEMDSVAAFLAGCGARALDATGTAAVGMPDPARLLP